MTFFLTRWFYALMQFLYGLFNNNYLLTIIVVTVFLRLFQIFPDISNRKTQIKMAVVQPQINELQKKYANDPQKLRLEQSKLMKEQCEKYHIPYYETAHDRDKVIQKLLDEQIEGSLRGKKDGRKTREA